MRLTIPILLYHRIDDAPLSTSTSPLLFRQHMQWLKEREWKSLSSDEFAFAMRSGRAGKERSFLITFDDGYESVRSAALDILREFDFKAISFLSTAFLLTPHARKIALLESENSDSYMSWEQTRELQASGIIDCQSHSHRHDNFTAYSPDMVRQDLAASVELLSTELRLPQRHFSHLAWPWGLSNPAWRDIAAAVGFKYQYDVSRQSAKAEGSLNQIPRNCFDGTSISQFHRQLWLQTSHLSPLWDVAYPLGRRLRQFSSRFLRAAA